MSVAVKQATGRPLTIKDNQQLPPLQNGDRLDCAEFERRYTAQPELKKAELLEGVVYMSSPVAPRHGAIHSDLMAWLGVYRAATPACVVLDNTSLRLDIDNEPQPDAAVLLTTDGVAPAGKVLVQRPVLIAEVAASSAAYDLHQKLHSYRRNGIAEYLVFSVFERRTYWHCWRAGDYVLVEPEADGVLRSRALPGLWLAADRFWAGELAAVLAVLQQGIASSEHAQFLTEIRR